MQPWEQDATSASDSALEAAATVAAARSMQSLPLRQEFEHITRKMYTQNLALAQTNRTLSILSKIDELSLDSSRDIKYLSLEICEIVVGAVPFPVAAILSLNKYQEEFMSLQGIAYSELLSLGNTAAIEPTLRNLYLSLNGSWLDSDRPIMTVDVSRDGFEADLNRQDFDENFVQALQYFKQQCGVGSVYLTKLFAHNTVIGVLMVGLEGKLPTIDDMELVERISTPAGVTLDNRLLYEENQRFLQQLQATNNHLKELDAAKDEFIALVSHQLRTPLTSIKGFLSLVLEGDTGPVSDEQRSMLQHAFESSQRMVYLIADLLNASRLRSGKFVIMNRETYLPDLVEAEIGELQSTAKSRNIQLTFERPDNFPKLMLDETKIRQVVMNFLDNALFYTPAGGSVRAALTASDSEVTFTVKDTGLGVPQAERDKLFGQYYRANNAKKVRPEGTGLGLYMAKKVVDAQGGSVIFESEEGKGSTFGFRIPLNAAGVTPAQDASVATPQAQ